MSAPAPGAGAPPPARPPLNLAAEVPIFVGVLALYALWLWQYFSHHHGQGPALKRRLSKLRMKKRADLWTTAKDTRTAWAEEMMADPKEGKVVADSMRNTIMGATVMVMGVSQIMARLIQVWYDTASLQQIEAMTASDPVAPRSFASPSIRIGLAIMTLQLALAAFANAARLAIHLTFVLRVVAGGADVGGGAPLRREAIALVHRVSLYFSVGVRASLAFALFLAWTAGVTTFLCFGVPMLALIAWSDYIPVPRRGEDADGERDGDGDAGGGRAGAERV